MKHSLDQMPVTRTVGIIRRASPHVREVHFALRCTDCGGTILDHAHAGAPRGSCHCPRGPGHVIGTLLYHTDEHPGGGATYAVAWEGRVVPVEPPTLTRAVDVLNMLRMQLNQDTDT